LARVVVGSRCVVAGYNRLAVLPGDRVLAQPPLLLQRLADGLPECIQLVTVQVGLV
jgi:hypothetical protein